jgi:hypothetical protein
MGNKYYFNFIIFNLYVMMKYHEVITNAYVNKATAQNDIPDYLCTSSTFVKMK